jgi:hypothetical protein
MLGVEFNMFFSVRCIYVKWPLLSILVVTIIFGLSLAVLFQVTEGSIEGEIDLIEFWDSLWVVFIIITTVGYGDIYALSNLGRLSMILIAIIGNVLVSLIIMSLEQAVKLSTYEIKAFELVSRLTERERIQHTTREYVFNSMSYSVEKTKILDKFNDLKNLKQTLGRIGDDPIKQKQINNMNYEIKNKKENLMRLLNKKFNQNQDLKVQYRKFANDFVPHSLEEMVRKRLKYIGERFGDLKTLDENNKAKSLKILNLLTLMEKKTFASEYLDT